MGKKILSAVRLLTYTGEHILAPGQAIRMASRPKIEVSIFEIENRRQPIMPDARAIAAAMDEEAAYANFVPPMIVSALDQPEFDGLGRRLSAGVDSPFCEEVPDLRD